MTYALTLVRLLPLPFAGRLAIAFTEIAIAAVLVSGSVVLGHDLKDWRSWYADPATNHPWAPTPKPSAIASGATQVVVAPRTVATPQVAAASQIGVSARVAVPLATPAPACETSSGELQLVFVRPVTLGADCVWLQQLSDGTHLLVQATSFTRTDLGVVAMPHATPAVRVFAPRPVWRCAAIRGPSPLSTTLRPDPAHLPPSFTPALLRDDSDPVVPMARRSEVRRSVVGTPELVILRGTVTSSRVP